MTAVGDPVMGVVRAAMGDWDVLSTVQDGVWDALMRPNRIHIWDTVWRSVTWGTWTYVVVSGGVEVSGVPPIFLWSEKE